MTGCVEFFVPGISECVVEECGGKRKARGYCNRHCRDNGDVLRKLADYLDGSRS